MSCCVCGKPPVDALELRAVLICRLCAAAIGSFLEGANDAVRELALALRPIARIFLSQEARPEALGDVLTAFPEINPARVAARRNE